VAAIITVFEFSGAPNASNEALWPADVTTRTTAASTVNLANTTRAVIVTCDTDCRLVINNAGAAAVSDIPVMSAVQNLFWIGPQAGNTLKFV
jgi:hypothetical protein